MTRYAVLFFWLFAYSILQAQDKLPVVLTLGTKGEIQEIVIDFDENQPVRQVKLDGKGQLQWFTFEVKNKTYTLPADGHFSQLISGANLGFQEERLSKIDFDGFENDIILSYYNGAISIIDYNGYERDVNFSYTSEGALNGVNLNGYEHDVGISYYDDCISGVNFNGYEKDIAFQYDTKKKLLYINLSSFGGVRINYNKDKISEITDSPNLQINLSDSENNIQSAQTEVSVKSIIRHMYLKGLSKNEISNYTGLSVSQVETYLK